MPVVYPKDFFEERAKKVSRGSCFVLMPFDPKFKEIYITIKEALAELNIECTRADDFHKPHIIETILNGINYSEYIIADLTDANPNVFYELGLSHTVKKINNVILLSQDIKFVPFDLRQFRCILYDQSISGAKKLHEEIIKTFNEASKDTFRIKLKENKKVPLGKKIIGAENYLYDLKLESPSIGHNAIKLQIHFTRYGADKSKTPLETQYLFLSEEQPVLPVDNLSWTVSLLRTNGEEATIALEKKI